MLPSSSSATMGRLQQLQRRRASQARRGMPSCFAAATVSACACATDVVCAMRAEPDRHGPGCTCPSRFTRWRWCGSTQAHCDACSTPSTSRAPCDTGSRTPRPEEATPSAPSAPSAPSLTTHKSPAPSQVHHLAMSNYSGVALYRAAPAIGLEHYELGKDVAKYRSERVQCLTLDAFAARHLAPTQWPSTSWRLPPAARRAPATASGALGRIDLLSVDVEGQDALVIEGALGLLRRKAIDVLEFEYIGRGFWRSDKGADQRQLSSTLATLQRHGYDCYWQGESGSLARASGQYWCDEFAFRLRSNLVCSHREDILRTLDGLAVA